MLFGEAISIALQSLRANKLRSLLTVLGILIGVSSVIAVVAITEGLDQYMSDKVLELGTKAFRLQSRPDIINSHEMWLEMMKRKRLNMDDFEAVQKACTLCSEVGAQVWTGTNVKRGRIIQKNVGVAGITENIARIGTIRDLAAGRHIVQQDVTQAAMVGVIGTDLVDAFFGTMEPHRQGDRHRRPPDQGHRRRREEGRRVRREPGQLRLAAASPPSRSSTAPAARSASRPRPGRWPISRRRRTRCASP